ncbi:class I SAM-dependent methyltransferase [Nonomuraea sp. NPDC049784]|uniref:class I SAM-dependent methyltransferase n=1 Tax=Nonomuraea sp. NPDC049784 TaxID=3154361 RepID=UPI0033EC7985
MAVRLSRWRVLWILLTRNFLSCFLPEWGKILIGVVAILGFGAGLLLASGAFRSFEAVLIVAAAFGACGFAFVADRWRRRFPWRCPVLSLDDQPRLRELVADAARLAGFDTVPRVHVSAWAEVRGGRAKRGRPSLLVGLPLLLAADEAELRTLMVRELLAARRWRWHEHWAVHLFMAHHPDWPWLGEASASLRKALWAETRSLVGSERFTAGVRAELLLAGAFGWHVNRYAGPFSRRGGALDVYESFLWKIQRDGLLTRAKPEPSPPDMVEAIDWDTAQPVADGVALVPVPSGVMSKVHPKLAARLGKVISHKVLDRGGFALGGRPYRMEDIPAEEWAQVGEYQRERVIEAATKLLDRQATDLDVVELAVAGRAGELEWWHKDQPCPHPTPGVCALLPLFDVALRRKGYVHEHTFAQRELVGPLGDRINLVELAAKAGRGEPYGILLGGLMTGRDPDADAIRLAAESLAEGDATGWFERLYAESASGDAIVPWDSRSPHYLLMEWARAGEGRALVVGAGLGDDAEHVAGLGYETVAFDVSESAVRLAQERFPASEVRYQVADLLEPPAEWRQAFDLVVEIMTVQALPEPLHPRAIAAVADFVRPGGTLLVIASGREEGGPAFAPPWPLTPSEIAAFAAGGLETGEVEDLRDGERHRWRATFHRPA